MHIRALFVLAGLIAGGACAVTVNVNAAAKSSAAKDNRIEGTVVEAMSSGGYTYLRVDTGSGSVWAAAPEMAVKVGDRVVVSDAMPMTNFHSKTLNRTFDVVHFSGSVTVNGKTSAALGRAPSDLPPGHPPAAGAKGSAGVDLANIKRATNGKTVAEIHAGGAALAGKPVAVRGRVVKYNGGILGKNWLHIRDGSGAEGSNDLTVTSKDAAKVGDLVVVKGVLVANRDFGAGYKYPLMIEDAAIVVE